MELTHTAPTSECPNGMEIQYESDGALYVGGFRRLAGIADLVSRTNRLEAIRAEWGRAETLSPDDFVAAVRRHHQRLNARDRAPGTGWGPMVLRTRCEVRS